MHHIIINPAAGRGQSSRMLPELTALLDAKVLPYKILATSAPLDARRFARDICAGNTHEEISSGLIGIGGDGTLQEITAGMADVHKGPGAFHLPLGIVPCGSGNDFTLTLKKLGIPTGTGPLLNGILHNKTRAIDLITETAGGNTFINIANMGLDARIVQNAEPLRKAFGRNAYTAAALQSIARHKGIFLSVKADGKIIREGSFTLAAVCNGQYYGGGLRIAPSAAPDDGKITVCLVENISRLKIAMLFPSIIFEKHTKLKEVSTFTCRELSVSWEGSQLLCMDGNLSLCKSPLHFKILPGVLRLYV